MEYFVRRFIIETFEQSDDVLNYLQRETIIYCRCYDHVSPTVAPYFEPLKSASSSSSRSTIQVRSQIVICGDIRRTVENE